MKKYLEYFENQFDDTVIDKVKPENYPYVAYSQKEDKVIYTEIVSFPADNEWWYKTSDGDKAEVLMSIEFNDDAELISSTFGILGEDGNTSYHGSTVLSHTYDKESGWFKVKFDSLPNPLPKLRAGGPIGGGFELLTKSPITAVYFPKSTSSLNGENILYDIDVFYAGTIEQWHGIQKQGYYDAAGYGGEIIDIVNSVTCLDGKVV